MTDDDITRQIQETRRILARLNFDAERSNERSALVLLALLGLTPGTAWADATSPRLRTVEIMAWLRTHYGKDYKPNTRETIRRFTLHQFAAALLVEQNPDQPDRPVNSPKWCYQIHPRALSLLRGAGEAAFQQDLLEYLAEVPGLRDTYAKARDLRRIPVTLPDSSAVTLSPGGQNVLLKQMIEDFAAISRPAARCCT
jgi:type II restriction enzyme